MHYGAQQTIVLEDLLGHPQSAEIFSDLLTNLRAKLMRQVPLSATEVKFRWWCLPLARAASLEQVPIAERFETSAPTLAALQTVAGKTRTYAFEITLEAVADA